MMPFTKSYNNNVIFEYVNWYKPILHGIHDYIIYNQQNSKRLVQIIYYIILMVTIGGGTEW